MTDDEKAQNRGFPDAFHEAIRPILRSRLSKPDYLVVWEAGFEFDRAVKCNDIEEVKKLLATGFVNIDQSIENFTIV